MDDNMFNRLSIISDSDFDRIYSEDEQSGEESETGEEPETIDGESADELQQLIQVNTQILEYEEKIYNGVMCIIYFIVFAFVFKTLFSNIWSWLNGA